MDRGDLIVAAASRSYPGERENGDAWLVDRWQGRYRVVLMDGLGHGREAAKAARAATVALGGRPDLGPEDSLLLCHTALAGTRGAVVSVANIDLDGSLLQYAGVGNVEGRLERNGDETRLVAYRGVLGSSLPSIHCYSFPLVADWLLLLHTDGVSNRFALDEMKAVSARDPQALADNILLQHGGSTDDATVVVVCSSTWPG